MVLPSFVPHGGAPDTIGSAIGAQLARDPISVSGNEQQRRVSIDIPFISRSGLAFNSVDFPSVQPESKCSATPRTRRKLFTPGLLLSPTVPFGTLWPSNEDAVVPEDDDARTNALARTSSRSSISSVGNYYDVMKNYLESKSTMQGKTLLLFRASNPFRIFMRRIVANPFFELMSLMFILSWLASTIMKPVPSPHDEQPDTSSFELVELIAAMIFSLELACRILVVGGFSGPSVLFFFNYTLALFFCQMRILKRCMALWIFCR